MCHPIQYDCYVFNAYPKFDTSIKFDGLDLF